MAHDQIVLFGDSLLQQSFDQRRGFAMGAQLAHGAADPAAGDPRSERGAYPAARSVLRRERCVSAGLCNGSACAVGGVRGELEGDGAARGGPGAGGNPGAAGDASAGGRVANRGRSAGESGGNDAAVCTAVLRGRARTGCAGVGSVGEIYEGLWMEGGPGVGWGCGRAAE
nr:hypothetical protein CFP56_78399 [Quercus suber]